MNRDGHLSKLNFCVNSSATRTRSEGPLRYATSRQIKQNLAAKDAEIDRLKSLLQSSQRINLDDTPDDHAVTTNIILSLFNSTAPSSGQFDDALEMLSFQQSLYMNKRLGRTIILLRNFLSKLSAESSSTTGVDRSSWFYTTVFELMRDVKPTVYSKPENGVFQVEKSNDVEIGTSEAIDCIINDTSRRVSSLSLDKKFTLGVVTSDAQNYTDHIRQFPEDFHTWTMCLSGHVQSFARSSELLASCTEMQRRLDMMNITYSIMADMNDANSDNQELSLQNIVDRVVAGLYDVLYCDRVTLFILDDVTDELYCMKSKDLEGFRLPKHVGLVGHALMNGKVLNVPDAYDVPFFNRAVDKANGYRTKSVICMPIRNARGNIVAVIQALNKFSKVNNGAVIAFDDTDTTIVEEFGMTISRCIHKATLTENSLMRIVDKMATTKNDKYLSGFLSGFQSHKRSGSGVVSKNVKGMFDVGGYEQAPHKPFPTNLSIDLRKWDLDYFALDDTEMVQLAFQIIGEFQLFEPLGLDRDLFARFVNEICSAYLDNAYHNFRHGFAVMHICSCILLNSEKANILTPLETFACLVGSMCHDVGHPGVNNTFEINVLSDLAIRYNDISVLENFHASLTFQLMKRDDINILAHFKREDRQKIRNLIISAILNTDMTRHDAMIKNLKAKVADCEAGHTVFNQTDSESRKQLIDVIVHSSDIGVVTLPFDIFSQFSTAIQKEFNEQVQKEKDQGLPFAAWMEPNDPLSLAKMQSGFMMYVTNPLWGTLFQIFDDIEDIPERMADNLEKWKSQQKKLEAALEAANHIPAVPN